MSIFLRKAITVGPLRFNLSKSGIGVSAGIRGLRLGTGPRGNYVHMGRYGLYYRKTLPPLSPSRSRSGDAPRPREPEIPEDSHDPLQEIESAHVSQLVDSSSAEVLRELDEKRRQRRLWPVVAGLGGAAVVLGLLAAWPGWLPDHPARPDGRRR